MVKLSAEDHALIDNLERELGRYLDTIKRAQQFKLDDYLVLRAGYFGKQMEVKTNSYGAPIKYKVVHVNQHGIPFVKRVNKSGVPIGRLSSCIGMTEDEYFSDSLVFVFELDPDFADAILLQDPYDPTKLHRSKKDIWDAVTKHNKACRVPTRNLKELVDFFNLINIGETLWTSPVGSYFIQDRKNIGVSDYLKKVRTNISLAQAKLLVHLSSIPILTAIDKHGKTIEITPDFFYYKALYRARPRTYTELNI
jgi:hypothetical protein